MAPVPVGAIILWTARSARTRPRDAVPGDAARERRRAGQGGGSPLDGEPGQPGDVAAEDGLLLRGTEPDLFQVRDRRADVAGPALGVERAVGAEQHVAGAVEVDAAAQRVRGPEHGRVAVHLPEILDLT